MCKKNVENCLCNTQSNEHLLLSSPGGFVAVCRGNPAGMLCLLKASAAPRMCFSWGKDPKGEPRTWKNKVAQESREMRQMRRK